MTDTFKDELNRLLTESAKQLAVGGGELPMTGYLPGLDDFSLPAMVARAVGLLQEFQPEEGYYGCFSGGKDSVAIKELARLAGVKVTWHYSVTTIDPPELVRFIREKHPDVIWERHGQSFFKTMLERGYPTRRGRWCCEEYKEARSPVGARLILGIRGEESKRRAANWKHVTKHTRTRQVAINPILTWRAEHVWGFINSQGIPYCSLYDEGFDRLGCIGCPMASATNKRKEFDRWPGYERQWRRAFRLLWHDRADLGRSGATNMDWACARLFPDWEALWRWWSTNGHWPTEDEDECQGQLEMWA